MQLSLSLLALICAFSASLAAPVNNLPDGSSLVARGRIRHQLHLIGGDAHQLVCNVKDAFNCFNHDVKQHLRIIKSDLKEDFTSWKLDVRADFDLLIVELSREAVNFEEHYARFKDLMVNTLLAVAATTAATVELGLYDLRYHIALIWERLGDLEVDARGDIYDLLVVLSKSIHFHVGIEYTQYPESCTAVLTQIETVQKYYREKIKMVAYWDQLTEIHQQVLRATMEPLGSVN